MRALGASAQVVAGLLGLVASGILALANFGMLTEDADVTFSAVELTFSLLSVAVYFSIVVLAPYIWSSSARRRWLALCLVGALVTVGLSGGAGGMVLFGPTILIILALLLVPVRGPNAT